MLTARVSLGARPSVARTALRSSARGLVTCAAAATRPLWVPGGSAPAHLDGRRVADGGRGRRGGASGRKWLVICGSLPLSEPSRASARSAAPGAAVGRPVRRGCSGPVRAGIGRCGHEHICAARRCAAPNGGRRHASAAPAPTQRACVRAAPRFGPPQRRLCISASWLSRSSTLLWTSAARPHHSCAYLARVRGSAPSRTRGGVTRVP